MNRTSEEILGYAENKGGESSEKRHPIQVVAHRTGLSKDLLRAWERRHAAVDPSRTDTGRRLYSDEDIERLRLLREASAGGRAIGTIADLPVDELRALVREDMTAGLAPAAPIIAPDAISRGVRDGLVAVEVLDGERLRATLARAMVQLSPIEFTDDVIAPLMRAVGTRWAKGELDPGQEHLASSVVAAALQDLIALLHDPSPDAPEIVVATPAGQRHGIGALLVAASAAVAGWRVTHIGADLPAADIAGAVRLRGARALALSLVYPPDDPDLPAELVRIWNALPAGVELLVGGAAADGYSQTLGAIQAHVATDLPELRAVLMRRDRPRQ